MNHFPILLDGRKVSAEIENHLKIRVNKLIKSTGKIPGMGVVLIGNDPGTELYVKMKANACKRTGIKFIKVQLPEEITTTEVLNEIEKLNNDDSVSGILLQYPLPLHIDERLCFDKIVIDKDIDGVSSLGFGQMSLNEAAFGGATPSAVIALLDYYGLKIEGRHAVIAGSSPVLGKPAAMMLLNRNATVTICHDKTKNLAEIIKQADILIAATGIPGFIKAEWIKDNSIVIDAGYYQGMEGDIEVSNVKHRLLAYAPVPGGVGPMTIAMLLKHTVEATERKIKY